MTQTLTGATANAMHEAYKQASAGQRSGTLKCPRCSSLIRFRVLGAPHQTSGRCPAANCIHWSA